MESRRNGELRRSVVSALAAVLAAVVPSLVSSPALAEKAEGPAKGAETAKAEPKKAKKAPARKALSKAAGKQELPGKPEEAKKGKVEGKPAAAAAPKEKKAKKVASRAGAKGKKTAKKADPETPKRHCAGTPITLDRMGLEGQTLTLVDCRHQPVESAREALSVLARPWGAQKPVLRAPHERPAKAPGGHAAGVHGSAAHPPAARAPDELAPGVRLLDKGLLARLDAVAHRFPGRTISLVSGYRPQSRGSKHQSARALDFRVASVSNEELVAFCKTLPDTGCGYYPNSSFVHLDVRDPGTGPVSWIDTSGPGESPHYVRRWPPAPEDADTAVLPPDTQPRDGSADPWLVEPADEHAPDAEPAS